MRRPGGAWRRPAWSSHGRRARRSRRCGGPNGFAAWEYDALSPEGDSASDPIGGATAGPHRQLRHGEGRRTEPGPPEKDPDPTRARSLGDRARSGGGSRRQRAAALHLDVRRAYAEPALACPEGGQGTLAVGQLSRLADPVSQAVLARTGMGTMGELGAHLVCLLVT